MTEPRNVTEIAEQIVFGKTMADKLVDCQSVSFAPQLGKAIKVDGIQSPGRPPDLRMQVENQNNARPKDQQLENEKSRGQLLHFLANHELLATELMALVLLKFPDAPAAFRQGVYVTLQEEQEHTRMYIRRMKECGVEFGAFPVSGQFWRMVEPMQSPMEFVSRLSLTFEQANLDFSLHFANVFRRIGDQETAAVLQKIYEDEIAHVRHGLHWFQQWKQPGDSDWQAYQQQLEFPLSPLRGRGPGVAFNRQGRLQAGLSDEFIDAIEVFGQSRGRAVTVRWFDAGAEANLLAPNDKNSPILQQLTNDLEFVMLAVAKPDDILLVNELPSPVMRKHWLRAYTALPEFRTWEDSPTSLRQRKLHDVQPWAWTPANYRAIEPVLDSVKHQPEPWNADRVDLYRKSWSTDTLQNWLAECDTSNDQFASVSDSIGRIVFQRQDVQEALADFSARGFDNAIFKSDLATSGRGQRRLSCNQPLQESDLAWLDWMFNSADKLAADPTQPIGVIEPELERLVDVSFLWEWNVHESVPRFVGWTRPLVAKGRRYLGTRMGKSFYDCEPPLRKFLLEDNCQRLKNTARWLAARLTPQLMDHRHVGHFGVDAMVYQLADKSFQIKPMVELNPRTTMGHIALALGRRVANGVESEFRVMNRNEWELAGRHLVDEEMKFDRSRQWSSGVAIFNEFNEATKLMPVLLVGSSLKKFRQLNPGT